MFKYHVLFLVYFSSCMFYSQGKLLFGLEDCMQNGKPGAHASQQFCVLKHLAVPKFWLGWGHPWFIECDHP